VAVVEALVLLVEEEALALLNGLLDVARQCIVLKYPAHG